MIFRLAFIFMAMLIWSCNSNQTDSDGTESLHETDEVTSTPVERQTQTIEKYLDKNNLKAEQTSSGLFYHVKEQGGGNKAKDGSMVSFHTTGKLLDGAKFYSSLDDGQPLEAIIGQNMLVQGMEEGLQHFNAGGSGILFLPSSLGYGEKGFGEQIPPNTIIMFEVEVLSVD